MTPRLLGHALLNRDAVRFVEAPYHEFVVVTQDGGLDHGVPLTEARPETAVDWIFVGSYVGPLGLLLGVLGLLLALRPRGSPQPLRWLALAGCLFFWLSCGPNVTPSLWDALHGLPVFSSLRSPERLVLYVFLLMALAAGAGADAALRELGRRRGRRLARAAGALLLGALLLDVVPPSQRAYRQTFVEPDRHGLHRLPADVGFLTTWVERPEESTFYGAPVAPFAEYGLAVANGYTAVPVTPTAVSRQDPRYTGEAWLAGAGLRLRPTVTARRIEVSLDRASAETLVINQNFAPGWGVVEPAGGRARSHTDGRLAVDVPAGTSRVLLRYTPPGMWAGLLLAALGVPLVWFLSSRLRLR